MQCATEAWPALVPTAPFYECTVDNAQIVCADPEKFRAHVNNDNLLYTWAAAAAAACGISSTPTPDETPSSP